MNIFELKKRIDELLKRDKELADKTEHYQERYLLIVELSARMSTLEAVSPFTTFFGESKVNNEEWDCYQRILSQSGLR